MSLADQDYGNMEVVIVLNGGEDEDLERTANFYVEQDPQKFKLVKVEEGGACRARNVGFEHSQGDIVSFFNSDYRANPGMVRMWVDALLEHPECGFAYGGYEYATAPTVGYPSKPFDPYLLDVANYIDCGFPIWRKYVTSWDTEVKSLQDWDFWLSVIKTHGIKGHFIDRDISFVAEKPRPKGLTDDSSNNWIERVRFIKNKHGISTSDLVVTSLGAANHGVEIAKMLKADFRDDTIFKPNEYKALYMIGFYMRPTDQGNQHGSILGSFAPEVKKIIHFVGADIYWLRKFPYESMKYLAGVIKMGSTHVLSENRWAQAELKEFGIDSKVVPIPTYNDYIVKPLPETFRVALYLTNKSDFDKYLQAHTLSIVRAMPDVQFTGYGDGAKDFQASNFKHYGNMGKENYRKYVYENSCLLRLVRHDTLPMAGCDFLSAGRQFISNIKMDGPAQGHSIHIDTGGNEPMNSWDSFGPGFSDYRWPKTKSQIVQAIRSLKLNPVSQEDVEKQADYWKGTLDKKTYIETIYGLCNG